ncbi:hypothetical protein MEME101129_28195 [Methylobacterium mesophilicum]
MDDGETTFVDAKLINDVLQARFGLNELRRAEEWVGSRAQTYKYEAGLSARSARIKDATASLLRIEKACAELACAFDEASPDAYSVLEGYGPAGTNYRHLGWKPRGSSTVRDFQTLLAITGRYLLPMGPSHGPEDRVTEMLSIGPSSVQPRTVISADKVYTVCGEPISWSDAVAALGMRIAMVREDFDERFQQRDIGGKQAKYSEQVRGDPRWVLVRECTDVTHDFAQYWSATKLTGQKTGRFARLVYAIYDFANGTELTEKNQDRGQGDGLDGLDHYVRNFIKVYSDLLKLKQITRKLSDEERIEMKRLQLILNNGRDPKKKPKSEKGLKADTA